MAAVGIGILDVVWARDPGAVDWRTGTMGKWKMLVLMAQEEGAPALFFRINTRDSVGGQAGPGSIRLACSDHPFLDHDSFLYCGGPPLELDETQIAGMMAGQAIPDRQGVVGRIAAALHGPIRAAVAASDQLSETQRRLILASLDSLAG